MKKLELTDEEFNIILEKLMGTFYRLYDEKGWNMDMHFKKEVKIHFKLIEKLFFHIPTKAEIKKTKQEEKSKQIIKDLRL